jgi:hypothetical protein
MRHNEGFKAPPRPQPLRMMIKAHATVAGIARIRDRVKPVEYRSNLRSPFLIAGAGLTINEFMCVYA